MTSRGSLAAVVGALLAVLVGADLHLLGGHTRQAHGNGPFTRELYRRERVGVGKHQNNIGAIIRRSPDRTGVITSPVWFEPQQFGLDRFDVSGGGGDHATREHNAS